MQKMDRKQFTVTVCSFVMRIVHEHLTQMSDPEI